MKAKVLNEKYQLSYKIETDNGYTRITKNVEYKDAYWEAFLIAGTHKQPVTIQRITTVETPVEAKSSFSAFLDGIGEDTTDLVTGAVTIDAEHFARDTKLSRYHPNNGWAVPEYINDFDNVPIAY